jgi:hypothetical protein
LEPGSFTNARYLARRLRRGLPSVPILVGFWTLSEEDAIHRAALRETGTDLVVTSLRQAVEQVTLAKGALIPGRGGGVIASCSIGCQGRGLA